MKFLNSYSISNRDCPLILHCFADYGVESEILEWYGDVIRVGINAIDTNLSEPIKADAHIVDENKHWDIPFKENVTFDLGVFHPVCSKWASTTSISGEPDDHVDMIPSARAIAERYCRHYVIENVSQAPLVEPVVLNGRMFGLPIKYERAFETNFEVTQPPRYRRYWGIDGANETAETSSFFFTERSRNWWASVKTIPPRDYPKQHLAKNTIPGSYIHHVCRAWLAQAEDEIDIDYSDYDRKMKTERREKFNRQLSEYVSFPDDKSSEEQAVESRGNDETDV